MVDESKVKFGGIFKIDRIIGMLKPPSNASNTYFWIMIWGSTLRFARAKGGSLKSKVFLMTTIKLHTISRIGQMFID